jgi:hypothetical protein
VKDKSNIARTLLRIDGPFDLQNTPVLLIIVRDGDGQEEGGGDRRARRAYFSLSTRSTIDWNESALFS